MGKPPQKGFCYFGRVFFFKKNNICTADFSRLAKMARLRIKLQNSAAFHCAKQKQIHILLFYEAAARKIMNYSARDHVYCNNKIEVW